MNRMDSGIALRVSGLSYRYGRETVLSDIGFRIPRGQICALLGPNGSGKTTLIKSVCGILPHTGSCCLADGSEIRSLPPHARARFIGYASSHPVIPSGLRCLDLVLTGLSAELGLFRPVAEEQRTRAMNLLEELGIRELAERDADTLSGGQRQLAILARAVIAEPEILLLDEPDAALDFRYRNRVMKYLRQRAQSSGTAVILSSHDGNAMLLHADRVLLLSGGRITADVLCADPGRLSGPLKEAYGNAELVKFRERWMIMETGGETDNGFDSGSVHRTRGGAQPPVRDAGQTDDAAGRDSACHAHPEEPAP